MSGTAASGPAADGAASGGTAPGRVVVLGTGLIGTSVALALRARGSAVWLADSDGAAARLAADIGAGDVLEGDLPPGGPADIAVLAMPPAAVAPALAAAQRAGLARCYTDVASVKELPLGQARALHCDLSCFVPGHPLSGRERSGPAAARADLFLGRPWVLCPGTHAAPDCVQAAADLARACGAQPVTLDPAAHDAHVALVSHVPHLLAAVMAGRLEGAPAAALGLAGPGVRDVTRIAAGEPALWTQILTANAGHVAAELAGAAQDLTAAAAALAAAAGGDETAIKQVTLLLERGGAGVAALPGKHGRPAPDYAVVQVVIGDRPGELHRLFGAAGEAGINIEDVSIEHSPGLPAGVAELSVRPEAAARLIAALAAGGWPVRRQAPVRPA